MKIPKICNWYKIVPVTYKIGTTYRYDHTQPDLEFYMGFEAPIVLIKEYQIKKKFLFWWFPIKEYEWVKNFKTQEDAVNYIVSHNKGRVINLIRE